MSKIDDLAKPIASLAKWVGRGFGKTIFANFRHDADGSDSLVVGYGRNPAILAGGSGAVLGIGFGRDAGERNSRSYLILAFPNGYTGPELAEYLGGKAVSFKGGSQGEDDVMASMAREAVEKVRRYR